MSGVSQITWRQLGIRGRTCRDWRSGTEPGAVHRLPKGCTFVTVTALRSTLSHRRALRADRLRLERDLAGYRTPAERNELAAIMSRYTAEEIRPLERILSRS